MIMDFYSISSRTDEWRLDKWDFVELKGAKITDFVDTFFKSSLSVSSKGHSVKASELSSEFQVQNELLS